VRSLPGEDFDGFEEVAETGAWAIHRALLWLGARQGEAPDAFDAIGLGARRDRRTVPKDLEAPLGSSSTCEFES